jgi:exopolyphosphatase/guanosine-5'-triphosphate,3'-diphosphate pyrophosphatase
MRIAAIDIGTNSIHMVVADAVAPGSFTVVDRERDVVQIGRGSFATGRLRRDAIRRSVESLARFTQLARRLQCDRIVCTATAAVREAQNGGDFLQMARTVAGIGPRVIPAEEEGRLIYLAVQASLQLGSEPSLIVDIGGGSVQLVVGDKEKIRLAVSAPLGALRLTETLVESDPVTDEEIDKLRRHIRKHAKAALEQVKEHAPTTVYGSSGSIHALAQVAHWMETGQEIEQINGYVLATADLEKLTRRLAKMTLAEREDLKGIDARRAEIILPGALVLLHVLEKLEADGVTLSDYGVREGLVTDYIRFHEKEISRLGDVEDLRLRSVYALLDRFQADGPHPRHVARLALSLYDGLKTRHRLPSESRDLLQYAALLHDIGSVVGFDGHAEHSAYVIRNGMLRGLSADEVDLVAAVARFHSKGKPGRSDSQFAALAKPERRRLRWMAAILRVAESLDRSHYQLIRTLRVEGRRGGVTIRVGAKRDAKLELWAAERRVDLLARMLGTKKRPARVRLALEATADLPRAESRAEARARTEPKPLPQPPSVAKGRGATPPAIAVVPRR